LVAVWTGVGMLPGRRAITGSAQAWEVGAATLIGGAALTGCYFTMGAEGPGPRAYPANAVPTAPARGRTRLQGPG
jgi:hypothetical protein